MLRETLETPGINAGSNMVLYHILSSQLEGGRWRFRNSDIYISKIYIYICTYICISYALFLLEDLPFDYFVHPS